MHLSSVFWLDESHFKIVANVAFSLVLVYERVSDLLLPDALFLYWWHFNECPSFQLFPSF